jgi:hypothetical protein
MLRSLKGFNGFSMAVADGPAGVLDDVYLDDGIWAVRHLVLRLEEGIQLLIPPAVVRGIDWIGRTVRLDMERRHLASLRPADEDLPVSVLKEREAQRRLAYAACAGMPGACHGGAPYAFPVWPLDDFGAEAVGDPHLRSARELIGYRARAFEGKVGRVVDFLFDESSWKIPFLGIAVRRRMRATNTAIPTRFASAVDWARRAVSIDLGRSFILAGPSMPYFPSLESLTTACRTEGDTPRDFPVFGGPEGI